MCGIACVNKGIARNAFWSAYWLNVISLLIWWLYVSVCSASEQEWGITEFLINFRGGYVRRGLLGEVLHCFCAHTGYAPNVIIIPLCLCCFGGFCFLMWHIVKKLRFCWLVLLTNYGIFGAYLIRKDYLIFILLAAALWLYSSVKQPLVRFLAPLALFIVMLHIHEASYFYCVPVYLLIIFSDKSSGFSLAEKVGQVILITLTMAVLCLHKGDKTVAEAIVNSWQVAYPESYHQLYTCAIAAIGWDSSFAFNLHFNYNFVAGTIPYSGFILRPVALLVVLFLMVRVGLRRHLENNTLLVDRFIYISLVLFLMLLPMFTIVSCDFQRVVFYWMMSAIIALYYLSERQIFLMNIPILQKGIANVRNLILKPFGGKPPYILLLIFGIPFMSNTLVEYGPPSFSLIMRVARRIAEAMA